MLRFTILVVLCLSENSAVISRSKLWKYCADATLGWYNFLFLNPPQPYDSSGIYFVVYHNDRHVTIRLEVHGEVLSGCSYGRALGYISSAQGHYSGTYPTSPLSVYLITFRIWRDGDIRWFSQSPLAYEWVETHKADSMVLVRNDCPKSEKVIDGRCTSDRCAKGKYGNNCQNTCTNCQEEECWPSDGQCKQACVADKTGFPKCNISCTAIDKWGPKCDLTCKCLNRFSCKKQGANEGKCPGGCDPYYGGKNQSCDKTCPVGRWDLGCAKNCHCPTEEKGCFMNGKCKGGKCEKYYYGDKCQTKCEFYYGPNCGRDCNCANNDECDHVTGQCPRGCALRHYKKKHCRDNKRECDTKDPACTNKTHHFYEFMAKTCAKTCGTCDGDFLLEDCEDTCPDGMFNDNNNCSSTCHCKDNTKCVADTGECQGGECADGYEGWNCQDICVYCMKGSDSVKKCHCLGNQACNRNTGECEKGCEYGYTGGARYHGIDCQDTCDKGWFSLDIDAKTCDGACHCQQEGQCMPSNGSCRTGGCQKGYMGLTCQTTCTAKQCPKTCHCLNGAVCNTTTGKCPGKCDMRYVGENCQTMPCTDISKYLVNGKCTGRCQCFDRFQCNVSDGTCGDGLCREAQHGPACQVTSKYGNSKSVGIAEKCHCDGDGPCDPIYGTCLYNRTCAQRYYGKNCTQSCTKDGLFADSTGACVLSCHCKDPKKCRARDGACLNGLCEKGWGGTKLRCNSKIRYGKGKKQDEKPCRCLNGEQCDGVTGRCPGNICDTRYFDNDCQKTCPVGLYVGSGGKCTEKCNCLNNRKCQAANGACGSCKAGYKGSQCKTKCDGNMYGYKCNKACHCALTKDNKAVQCHHITGACPEGSQECHHRFYGTGCQKTCDAGKFGEKCDKTCNCLDDTKCHVVGGKCGNGCAPGYELIANDCQHKCSGNMYGEKCAKMCHCNMDLTCDHKDGRCEGGCSARYTGNDCQLNCTQLAKYGPPSCNKDCQCANNAYCRVTDGRCMKYGCSTTNQNCDKACSNNTFGENCEQDCKCRNGYMCDSVTGECPAGCATRFYSESCNDTCPIGTYLNKNTKKCTETCQCAASDMCNVETGVCEDGNCKTGYKGERCNIKCDDGTWGEKCKGLCYCDAKKPCNHITGVCPGKKCDRRHTGDSCTTECPANTFLVDGACTGRCHCNDNGKCAITDGDCGLDGCLPGWGDSNCQLVCVNKFGKNCNNECHCRNNKPCNRNNGTCLFGCQRRYTGANCSVTCDVGHWGPPECKGGCRCFTPAKCRVVSGFCEDGICMTPRFAGQYCNITCTDNKRYRGIDGCTELCRCRQPLQCRVTDGVCLRGGCQSGWKGLRCDEPCEAGTYGFGCSQKCRCKFNRPCARDSGNCKAGCIEGWTGESCNFRKDYSKLTSQVGGWAGGAMGVVVIGVLLGLYATYRRKKKEQDMVAMIERDPSVLFKPGFKSSMAVARKSLTTASVMSFVQDERKRRRSSVALDGLGGGAADDDDECTILPAITGNDGQKSEHSVVNDDDTEKSKSTHRRRKSQVDGLDDVTVGDTTEKSKSSRRRRKSAAAGAEDAADDESQISMTSKSSRKRRKKSASGAPDDGVSLKSTGSRRRSRSKSTGGENDVTDASMKSKGSKRKKSRVDADDIDGMDVSQKTSRSGKRRKSTTSGDPSNEKADEGRNESDEK